MFVVMPSALALLCSVFLTAALAEDSDYLSLCSLFKQNTKLRVPGSCDKYIICNGSRGQIFNCPDQTKYDANQQKCLANLDTTELCENRCINAKTGTFAADPTNCRAFYYCENKQAAQSHCSVEHYFEYNKQQCVYPRNSQCILNVNAICELVADKTLFRDEKDCSKHYKCEKTKLTKADCKTQYFNVETGKCAAKSTVACLAHRATADTCLRGSAPFVGKIPDGATCRGYFICSSKGPYAHDLHPIWYHCEAGKFFDASKQQCLPAIDVKCNFNRCESRGNALVVSGNNNCRNYLQCENDTVLKESTCEYHYFFDERRGTCVPYIVYDKSCDDTATHTRTHTHTHTHFSESSLI